MSIKKKDPTTVNRAVIYVRVSTKVQVQNFSLATQEATCRAFCEQSNFTVDRVFVEKGESAKTTDRTELQKMLTYCRENKGRVQWVLVYDVKRFARDIYDHAVMRALLSSLGVNLRSATERFDETSAGRFMENIMAAVAQHDNETRRDKTVEGMKKANQAGRWTFKAPPGYLNNGGKLVHDPERAPLVQLAFQIYSTGLHTQPQVLAKVSAAGLITASSGRPFKKQTFEKMLRNPLYAGWIDVNWGEPVRGDFEPLVSQEMFDRVQAVLHGKGATLAPRLRSHPDFPLRHFVKCGACNRPLTGSWSKGRSKKYAFYRCPNSRCVSIRKSVNKGDLEGGFVNYLQRMQPKPDYLNLFNAVVLDVWRDRQTQNLALSASLKAHVEDLQAKSEKLDRTFAIESAIDGPTYNRLKDKLAEEIALAQMQEHDAKLDGFDVEGVLNFAEHVIGNCSRLWTEFSFDQKLRLQKVLFPEGVTFDGSEFGTAVTCPLFNLLENAHASKARLATLRGFEPRLPP